MYVLTYVELVSVCSSSALLFPLQKHSYSALNARPTPRDPYPFSVHLPRFQLQHQPLFVWEPFLIAGAHCAALETGKVLRNVIIPRSGPQSMTQKQLVLNTTQHERKMTDNDTLETLDQLLPKAALTWDFLIHKWISSFSSLSYLHRFCTSATKISRLILIQQYFFYCHFGRCKNMFCRKKKKSWCVYSPAPLPLVGHESRECSGPQRGWVPVSADLITHYLLVAFWHCCFTSPIPYGVP